MDLEIIVFFYNILKKDSLDNNDFLLASSYINNNCIDLNKSLKDNAKSLLDDEDFNDIEGEIRNFINQEDELLDEPLYKLLLSRKGLCDLLKITTKNKKISIENMYSIVEYLLIKFESLDEDYIEVYEFLNSVITSYHLNKRIPSKIISKFVLKHENSFGVDFIEIKSNEQSKSYYSRIIILKLFSFGYVDFNYDKVLDPSSIRNNFDKLIIPLIENKKYGYLRMIINPRIIEKDQLEYVEYLISQQLDIVLEYDPDEKDKVDSFLQDIKKVFSLCRLK